ADEDYNKPENVEVQTSTDLLRQDLSEVRSEVIFLETNTDAIPKEEYELIRKENEKRAKDLEQEMRKLRKRTRKAELKAAEAQRELSNISKRPEKIIINKEGKTRPSKIVNKTYLTEGDSVAINQLELEMERLKNASLVSSQRKDEELDDLRAKLAALETKMNISQSTGGNTDAATLDYMVKLEEKLNNLDAQLQSTKSELSSTKSELATVKNRPAPAPAAIVQPQIIQPRPTPNPRPSGGLIVTVNPAKEAIDRLGNVNVYFGTGKSSIEADYFNELNRVVNLMNQYPNITARLVGYTDKSGNPTANLKLSQKRSESVASYLRSRGVNWSRIKQNSQGDIEATKKDDPFSRRVEVVLSLF
ncbi:MAG: OmpA family protein, partial [Saprospiraceae bacterium]